MGDEYGYESFYVQLQYQNGSHICGGTIISSYLILTAAHCLQGVHYRDVRVVAGQHRIRNLDQTHGDAQIREVDDVIIHDKFDPITYNYNVALLALNDSLDFRSNTGSILIPDGEDLSDSAMVGGWINVSEPNLEQAETFTQYILTKGEDGIYDYGPESNILRFSASLGRSYETRNGWKGDPGSPYICFVKRNPSKRYVCAINTSQWRRTEGGDKETWTNSYLTVDCCTRWIRQRSCYDRWKNPCPYEYYRCRNNFCVPRSAVCDRFVDCYDGSDEEDCPYSVKGAPGSGSYGRNAQPGEIPFQVQLRYKNGSHLCGGTILSTNLILAAAHCFDKRNCRDIQVVAGQHSLSQNDATEQIVDIQTVIIHEDYDPEIYENDIALLVLNRSLRFGYYVYNAIIPDGTTTLKDFARVSGWGNVPEYNLTTAETLRVTEVTIFDPKVCNEKWGELYPMNETRRLCALGQAEAGVRDACRGDSGGPLQCFNYNGDVLKQYVCGIVSAGPGVTQCGDNSSLPGLYVKVSSYHRWILNRTCLYREQEECPPYYLRCCNHLCVHSYFVCDGVNDCGDNSDERYCVTSYVANCPKPIKCRSRDVLVCPEIPEMPKDRMQCGSILDFSQKTKQHGNGLDSPENHMEPVYSLNVKHNVTNSGNVLEFNYKTDGTLVHLRVA